MDRPAHVLLYGARMQYVNGHATTGSTQRPKTWSICKPAHFKPRDREAIVNSTNRRPSTVPAPLGHFGDGRRPSTTGLERRPSMARRGSKAGRGLPSSVNASTKNAFSLTDVARQAMGASSARGGEGQSPGRTTCIQFHFMKGLANLGAPKSLDKRLEMKRAENQMRLAAERAKLRRRSSVMGDDTNHWILQNQAGCWFWLDRSTGVATPCLAPPDGTAVGASFADVERARSSSTGGDDALSAFAGNLAAFSPVKTPAKRAFAFEDEQQPLGTGSPVYDPREFREFMALVEAHDAPVARPRTAPASRPMASPVDLSSDFRKAGGGAPRRFPQ